MGRGLLRYLVQSVTGLLCLVGYFSPFFDGAKRNQGWHDKAANDLVVNARSGPYCYSRVCSLIPAALTRGLPPPASRGSPRRNLAGTVLWSSIRAPTPPAVPPACDDGTVMPLCGGTRAGYALLHADPATALRDNALFVAALPLLVVLWWHRSAARFAAGQPGRCPGRCSGPGSLLVLAFGVLRNLPQGRWLAPPV